jgi:glycosyltransferase involved in cell wall biosynthesis
MVERIIGIDARELERKPTGVGAYLRGILEELQLPEKFKLQLYFKNGIPKELPAVDAEPIVLKTASTNVAWQQWTLCRELTRRRVDLLFSPANTLPWRFTGIQTLTVHDLSYFSYPFWFKARERLTKQLNTSISIRSSDRIYADCEYVKAEIMQHFEVPASKICVAPVGAVSRNIDVSRRHDLRAVRRLSKYKVILYAGSIFNRRHLPILIKSLSHLDHSYVLVIVGENRTFPKVDLELEARSAGVQDRVQILEYVSDTLLQDFYLMADVFVYLSEYEGFGIPPLEAMSYGIPVIVSDTPAMNTIYRDSAHLVSMMEPGKIAEAIRIVLENEDERLRLIEAGRAKVAASSWRQTAQIIAADWEQLLDSAG